MIKGNTGFIEGSNSNGRKVRFEWADYYDVATNKSKVCIIGIDYYSANSETAYNLNLYWNKPGEKFYQSHRNLYSGGSGIPISTPGEYRHIYSGSIEIAEVAHALDGSATFYLDSRLDITGYSSSIGVYVKGTIRLTDIPRASTFAISGNTNYPLGSPLVFTITKAVDEFIHTLSYKCGTETGTICTESTETEIEWTPPISLAQQNTIGTAVPITFTLETLVEDAVCGSRTVDATLFIPESVKPTVLLTFKDTTDCFDKYGAYVQGKSSLEISLTMEGAEGSAILSHSVLFDGYVYTQESFTTDAIKNTGELALGVTVKDSRGRTVTVTENLTVLEYEPPKFTGIALNRCNQSGELDTTGAYFIVVFNASVSPLDNKNSAIYTLQYKKVDESGYTTRVLNGISGVYDVSGASAIFAADVAFSYDVMLSVADDFTTATKSMIGSSIKKLWSALAKGLGFAFGKIAEKAGFLDMGFGIFMNQNKVTDLPPPVLGTDAATKAYVDDLRKQIQDPYPIGSYYFSKNNTNPTDLFGGEWRLVEGVTITGISEPLYVWLRTGGNTDSAILGEAVLGEMILGKGN